jgi:hypothetical protein
MRITELILHHPKESTTKEAEMRNYTKSFFSKKRAVEFAEHLEMVGAEDIQITAALDAFGKTQYRVEWNED